MRTAVYKTLYKRDFKREYRDSYKNLLAQGREVDRVIWMLANDIQLPPKYRDHSLIGTWKGSRECHIRPDLLLVYRYEGDDELVLERLGSHGEIFGM